MEEWQQKLLAVGYLPLQRGFEVNLTHQYIIHTRQKLSAVCTNGGF
ncbi:hypothetical protein ACT691_15160 [Vibrio metschnikovii]